MYVWRLYGFFDWRNFKAFCIDKMKFVKKIKANVDADV